MRTLFYPIILLVSFIQVLTARGNPGVFVDDKGVMRLTTTNEEAALFGVGPC